MAARYVDRVVADVCSDLLRRSDRGQETYGTTLDRTDLTPRQWAQHAYEECLDMALYLRRLMRDMPE